MKRDTRTNKTQGSGNYFKNEKPKPIKIPRPVENTKPVFSTELVKTLKIIIKAESLKKLIEYTLKNNIITKILRKGWHVMGKPVGALKNHLNKADNSLARFTENIFSFEEHQNASDLDLEIQNSSDIQMSNDMIIDSILKPEDSRAFKHATLSLLMIMLSFFFMILSSKTTHASSLGLYENVPNSKLSGSVWNYSHHATRGTTTIMTDEKDYKNIISESISGSMTSSQFVKSSPISLPIKTLYINSCKNNYISIYSLTCKKNRI
jgi:hypothetical protein